MVTHPAWNVASDTPNVSGGGIALSIDLKGTGEEGSIGYRGKHHTSVVDVDRKNQHDVFDFWEPLYAAEMTPFDPLVDEFRVHYAGFFDPGFGRAPAGGTGSRAVLEVRSHEVPFILDDGQIVGRLIYEHMLDAPEGLYGSGLGSNYQAQGLKLSKHFRTA
jgi:dCTP deaminase